MSLAWDDFRLVKAVADRGGLTQAAAHLGINHSTAFRRLAGLEAGLGTRLFERSRGGYVPTQAGAAMVAAAGRMEADVARFGREAMGRTPDPSGLLRVTAPAGLAVAPLMPLLAAFRLRHPGITLALVVAEAALNLSRRDADVALRASNDPPANLVGRRLSGLGWALYARAGEPGAPPPDPAACDWVVPGPDVGGGLFRAYARARMGTGRIALEIDMVLGLAEAVRAGLGIGPLPCFLGDADPGLARLGPPEPELASSLWLLTHPDLREAGRVRAFMDFMAEAIPPLRPALEGRAGAYAPTETTSIS